MRKDIIKFAFAGDMMLGGEFLSGTEKNGLDYLLPFRRIDSFFSDSDIFFMNLEGPIFNGPKKRQGVTALLSNHPAVLNLFKGKKVCVLNLANNHIMDYTEEGLAHTLRLLKDNGIFYVGAGLNHSVANKELIIEHKGKRIAFLAFTSDDPYVGSVIAGKNEAGCASFREMDRVLEKIRHIRMDTDIICVSMHWGYEYFFYPSKEQVEFAHLMAEAGADYIIGHHPHVPQGVEVYKGSLIMYSLGNLFLPPVRATSGRLQPRKKISKEFMLVKSEFGGSRGQDIIGGYVNKDYIIEIYDENEQKEFNLKIQRISNPLCLPDYGQFWLKYKARRDRTLLIESLLEAFRKLSAMPVKDVVTTITIKDIKRNLGRLLRIAG